MNPICHPIKKTGMALYGSALVAGAVVSLGLTLGTILSVIALDNLLVKSLPPSQQESLYAVGVKLMENNMPIESSMLVLEKLQPSQKATLKSVCAPCMPLLW